MKNIFLIAVISLLTLTASAQRFGTGLANQDNTGASLKYAGKTITLASTDSIAPNAYNSFYSISVAGAKTVSIKNTNAQKYDKVTLVFTADGTTRLITFSGVKMYTDINRDTISVMSNRKAIVSFIYDGTKWLHCDRYQQH